MGKLGQLWRRLRTYCHFHDNDKLIAWLSQQPWVIWLTPQRRRRLLGLAAVVAGAMATNNRYGNFAYDHAEKSWTVPAAAFLLLSAALYLCYLAAAHYAKLPALVARRPQLSLHLVFWALLTALWFVPRAAGWGRSVLLLIAISSPFLLWRCGYLLLSGRRAKTQGTTFATHWIYLWPIWGGSNAPIGKGWDYLSQREAQDAETYARSVLSASRLLLLSGALELARLGLRAATGYCGIPRIKDVVTGNAEATLAMTWVSLYLELIWDASSLAAHGHRWVAALRLFGFNVFRNTYKPLLAETVIDFWNRYYYYFKELLLEFFFYPTYLRVFRSSPKLRLLAAVFAAAFFGNMYYHILQMKDPLVIGHLAEIVLSWTPRMIYCFLLALGIYVSMLRQQRRRGQTSQLGAARERWVKCRRIAAVWTFYALLNFWNLKTAIAVPDRVKIFLSFFGF